MILPKFLKRMHISKNEQWMFAIVAVATLARLLYTEKFALAIVILLSLGSIDIIFLQIRAVGEYPETELFSALIPLLAAWLALSSYSLFQRETLQTKRKRIIRYSRITPAPFLLSRTVFMGGTQPPTGGNHWSISTDPL